jgi:hypothetical protein
MKQKLIILVLFILALLPGFALAQEPQIQPYTEQISSYDIDLYLQEDNSVNVEERIVYTIGSSVSRHGIYRNIPIVYNLREGNRRQSFSDLEVTDENGKKLEVKKEGFNTISLRIGDPDKLIGAGNHTYVIKYKMKRAVSYRDGKSILSWNFIGDGWDFNIYNAKAVVHLPDGEKYTDTKCYVGNVGSDEKCTDISEAGNAVTFSQNGLLPRRAFTGEITFSNNSFAQPGMIEKFFWNFPWYVVKPFAVFLIFFVIWYRKGRDPRGKVVVAQYNAPKEIEPIEVGYLTGETLQNHHISSQIIFLAIRGFLRIKRFEKDKFLGFGRKDDYQLEKLKEADGTLKSYDHMLMNVLFKKGKVVNVSDLKDDFAKDAQKLKGEIYHEILNKGYFLGNPVWVRTIYFLIAGLILALGILVAIYLSPLVYGWISLISPGIIAGIFVFFMPSRSQKGAEMRNYLQGLKTYIRYAEADRIKFHNEPKKDPAKFEELLPYAMGFKLEKEWAKQFEDIYKKEPDWFVGGYAGFSASHFANDLNGFSASSASSFTSVTSSGGAGGGAGGGGGGGW